jgi:hypothetical protein
VTNRGGSGMAILAMTAPGQDGRATSSRVTHYPSSPDQARPRVCIRAAPRRGGGFPETAGIPALRLGLMPGHGYALIGAPVSAAALACRALREAPPSPPARIFAEAKVRELAGLFSETGTPRRYRRCGKTRRRSLSELFPANRTESDLLSLISKDRLLSPYRG